MQHGGDEHRVALQRLPPREDDALELAAAALEPRDRLAPHPDTVGGQPFSQVLVQRLAVGAQHQLVAKPG